MKRQTWTAQMDLDTIMISWARMGAKKWNKSCLVCLRIVTLWGCQSQSIRAGTSQLHTSDSEWWEITFQAFLSKNMDLWYFLGEITFISPPHCPGWRDCWPRISGRRVSEGGERSCDCICSLFCHFTQCDCHLEARCSIFSNFLFVKLCPLVVGLWNLTFGMNILYKHWKDYEQLTSFK